MPTDLFRLDLRLRRRMVLGTALGAATYFALVVAIYPAFKSDSSLDTMAQANPAAAAAFGITGAITSPAGWLGANMYANIAPLLALLLTIGYGASAIAGQNTDGVLGLVATLPLGRTRTIAQKVAALLVVSLVVPLGALLVCLAGPHFEVHPDWSALGQTTVTLTLLVFDFGALALLAGAVTGTRGAALGIAGVAAAAAYLVSSMAPVIHALHSIRWLSPFYWAIGNDQLNRGATPVELALLAGLGVALVIASVAAYRRLDVR